jgi:hypothetical protein
MLLLRFQQLYISNMSTRRKLKNIDAPGCRHRLTECAFCVALRRAPRPHKAPARFCLPMALVNQECMMRAAAQCQHPTVLGGSARVVLLIPS